MSDESEPDLTLLEADIRNVVTVKELVDELRKVNDKLDRVLGGIGEAIVQLDRLAVIERWVTQVGQGMGIRHP